MGETSWAADLPSIEVANNVAWNEAFTVKNGDEPLDLTGATLLMEVRPRPESSTVILRFSTEEGGASVVDAEAGELQFYRDAHMMRHVPVGTYVRDIIIRKGGEDIYGGRGEVVVKQGISRR